MMAVKVSLRTPDPQFFRRWGTTWSLRFTGLGTGLPALASGIFRPQSTSETLLRIHFAAARTCLRSALERRR